MADTLGMALNKLHTMSTAETTEYFEGKILKALAKFGDVACTDLGRVSGVTQAARRDNIAWGLAKKGLVELFGGEGHVGTYRLTEAGRAAAA